MTLAESRAQIKLFPRSETCVFRSHQRHNSYLYVFCMALGIYVLESLKNAIIGETILSKINLKEGKAIYMIFIWGL